MDKTTIRRGRAITIERLDARGVSETFAASSTPCVTASKPGDPERCDVLALP